MSRRLLWLAVLSVMFQTQVLPRPDGCKSATVDKVVKCANVYVELVGLTSRRLQGRVGNPHKDSLAIVEIYKVGKEERKSSPSDVVQSHKPYAVIETNRDGEFCYPGLPDGYYVIRFGTSGGDLNCSHVKVRILSDSANRKLNVALDYGI